mgnify:CR=1 FL=1
MHSQEETTTVQWTTRILCMACFALLFAFVAALGQAAPALAQGNEGDENTATIVVQDEGGAVVRAITFTESITGLAALEATGLGLDLAETQFGPAICSIENTGCPSDNCFCNPDEFWGYNFFDGTGWQSWPEGAATATLTQTNAIDGWRWGVFGASMVSPQVVQALPALDWILAQQSPKTGGYANIAGSVEAAMALGANGLAADTWQVEGGTRSLADYLRVRQGKFSRESVAAAGKLAVALSAANACFARNTLTPNDWLEGDNTAYSTDSGANAWAILGAAAIQQIVPTAAIETLSAAVLPEGGWEWQAGFGADTNTTALAIQALIATGTPVTDTLIVDGLEFLKSAQQEDGGFAYDQAGGFGGDANSTAYVLQALAAVGADPLSDAWLVDGVSAVDFLVGLQLEDGSVEWQAESGSNLLATQQFVPALLAQAYPITVAEMVVCQ